MLNTYKAECCTCGAGSSDPSQEYCYVCGGGMVPLPTTLTLKQKQVLRNESRPCNCGSGLDWALCQGNPWDGAKYCG